MSLDLGGPAIEIAIALAFIFFLLSLVSSHLTEWLAGLLNLRAKTLRKGLEGMLGDDGVVERVLSHPLVRTDLQPDRKKRDPSYIAPQSFALALRDVVKAPAEGEKPAVRVDEKERPVTDALSTQLRVLPGGDTLPEIPELEKWFDESMDRVSGWYRRKSQLVTIAIAAALVLVLNISTLRIAEQLSAEPKVLTNVVAKAEAAAKEAGRGEGQTGGSEESTTDMRKAGEEAEAAVQDLAALSLPVFWTEETNRPSSGDDWLIAVAGWLISIAAISLGAPFWFDALNKLSNLRMAGKRPEEKAAAET
jgi:hypothetical protein